MCYKCGKPGHFIAKCPLSSDSDRGVSFECMIEGSRKINELGDPSEAQPVAFKATEEKKEEATPSRQPIDASKLDNEEMALVIKSIRQILKQRRGKITNPAPRRCATNVVSPVIL